MSDRRYRYPIGAALILVIVLVVVVDSRLTSPIGAPIVLLLLGTGALFEFLRMFKDRMLAFSRHACFLVGALLIAAPALLRAIDHPVPMPTLVTAAALLSTFIPGIALLARRWRSPVERGDLTAAALPAFGLLAIALPMAMMVETTFHGPHGLFFALIMLLGAKLNDMGGYIFGSTFGKHRLSPGISPKKSWEGSLGGLALSIGGTVLLWFTVGPFSDRPWWMVALAALAIGITSQMSDLFESAMKRDAGVKDSGNLLPSFGGFLDMVDTFTFAGPVIWLASLVLL